MKHRVTILMHFYATVFYGRTVEQDLGTNIFHLHDTPEPTVGQHTMLHLEAATSI